jgi:isocitrate dehydrogenase
VSSKKKSDQTDTIVVLHDDQTGEELLEQAIIVLDPAIIAVNVEFQDFDLSLENRRATKHKIVSQAAAAIREAGLGLKAATIYTRSLRRCKQPKCHITPRT